MNGFRIAGAVLCLSAFALAAVYFLAMLTLYTKVRGYQ